MNDLVGIIRKEDEITKALTHLKELWARYRNVQVEGGREYNPGWNLAIDLRNMLMVSECVARAALERTESRGGHTRDDHPGMDSGWRKTLLVCREAEDNSNGEHITVSREPQIPMRQDLLELFKISELEKYYTDEELAEHPERRA
ncbi:hypothetical protein IWGMT90018_05280 [Mycobacterium kiyosense]|nr:hypothetical protein IWGMT90018_05280 [Mycobacterium kiyosense]